MLKIQSKLVLFLVIYIHVHWRWFLPCSIREWIRCCVHMKNWMKKNRRTHCVCVRVCHCVLVVIGARQNRKYVVGDRMGKHYPANIQFVWIHIKSSLKYGTALKRTWFSKSQRSNWNTEKCICLQHVFSPFSAFECWRKWKYFVLERNVRVFVYARLCVPMHAGYVSCAFDQSVSDWNLFGLVYVNATWEMIALIILVWIMNEWKCSKVQWC